MPWLCWSEHRKKSSESTVVAAGYTLGRLILCMRSNTIAFYHWQVVIPVKGGSILDSQRVSRVTIGNAWVVHWGEWTCFYR